MTTLIKRLNGLRKPVHKLAGSTIAAARDVNGYTFLYFTDGTWACSILPAQEVLSSFRRPDEACDDSDAFKPNTECCPFVELGLATIEEIVECAIELAAEESARAKIGRRLQYERLKAEFEE